MSERRAFDFDPEAPGRPGSHFCAVVLAGLSYKSQDEVKRLLPTHGYEGTDVVFFRSPQTSGFVLEFKNLIFVVFRGSATLADWISNIKIYPKRTPWGRVHLGFYQTIEEIAPSLLQVVIPRIKAGKECIVTGHSRGGALATLFMFLLALNDCSSELITFGAPMCMDAEMCNHFRGEDEKFSEAGKYIPGWIVVIVSGVSTIVFLLCVFTRSYAAHLSRKLITAIKSRLGLQKP